MQTAWGPGPGTAGCGGGGSLEGGRGGRGEAGTNLAAPGNREDAQKGGLQTPPPREGHDLRLPQGRGKPGWDGTDAELGQHRPKGASALAPWLGESKLEPRCLMAPVHVVTGRVAGSSGHKETLPPLRSPCFRHSRPQSSPPGRHRGGTGPVCSPRPRRRGCRRPLSTELPSGTAGGEVTGRPRATDSCTTGEPHGRQSHSPPPPPSLSSLSSSPAASAVHSAWPAY